MHRCYTVYTESYIKGLILFTKASTQTPENSTDELATVTRIKTGTATFQTDKETTLGKSLQSLKSNISIIVFPLKLIFAGFVHSFAQLACTCISQWQEVWL